MWYGSLLQAWSYFFRSLIQQASWYGIWSLSLVWIQIPKCEKDQGQTLTRAGTSVAETISKYVNLLIFEKYSSCLLKQPQQQQQKVKYI